MKIKVVFLFIILFAIFYLTIGSNSVDDNLSNKLTKNKPLKNSESNVNKIEVKVKKQDNINKVINSNDILKVENKNLKNLKDVVINKNNEKKKYIKQNINKIQKSLLNKTNYNQLQTMKQKKKTISGYTVLKSDNSNLLLSNKNAEVFVKSNSGINYDKNEMTVPMLPSLVEVDGHKNIYTIPSLVLNNVENIDEIKLFDKKTGNQIFLDRNQIQQLKSGNSIKVDEDGKTDIDSMEELFPPMPMPSL